MSDVPEGFDLALLLAPIAGERAVGVDLREDFSPQSAYYRLRDARAEARASERAADAMPESDSAPPPQWRIVRDLAVKALGEQTKDLEIAAWYTEALVRSDGLAGLTAGAQLIAGLAEAFWDDVLPMPDEDGIATRVAPVTGLNGEGGDGTLIQPLRKLPLFLRPDGSMLQYWQYEQSAELSAVGDATRREQRLAAGVLPFDDVEKEARATRPAHFAALQRGLVAAEDAWTAMGTLLDERAGADGPPTSRVRDLLQQIRAAVAKYAPAEETEADLQAEAEGTADGAATGTAGTIGVGPARGASRDDMLRSLSEIAAFFRRTEPHSPLSATLDEAVRRGRLSYAELLEEVVPDFEARTTILMRLGIRPPTVAEE